MPDEITTTTSALTTALPYKCEEGLEDSWSPAKKLWCCENAGKGCTTTPTPTPPPKPTPPPTASLPFDCLAGLGNLDAGWSDAKKEWCCANQGKGCPPEKQTCTLWGDPHVITFDQPNDDKNLATSFYGDGDFWLVKSSTVMIGGRFLGTKYTEGLAATNRVLVTGPFIHNIKIEVGTQEDNILTVGGQTVIGAFPGSYRDPAGLFTINYNDQGNVPDIIPEGNEKRVVHINLPSSVTVTVFQWENYMDVQIEMPKQPGQDGVCGNFNGDLGDDTTQAIFSRVGARIKPAEDRFTGRAKIEFTPQMQKMMNAECKASVQASATGTCTASLGVPASDVIVKSCIFDECFGMNVRARARAKTYE